MGKKPLVNQRGVALLLFLVVLIAIAGTFVSNLLGSKVEAVNRSKVAHDYEVLRKAKQALLSYAVDYSLTTDNYADMGRLPCPDYQWGAGEGRQDGNCGVTHANDVGLLPWKDLGIDALRDSSGECLWYAASGDYKGSPRADMLNEDSNGLFNIKDENGQLYHGANPGDRPIAMIIAPGGALGAQDRSIDNAGMVHCKGNYDETNYLESDGSVIYTTDHANTADTVWTYIYGTASSRLENSNFNDKMVWITRQEYWDAVKAQKDLDASNIASPINVLTMRLAECVADYGNDLANEDRVLPWPAPIDLAEYRNDKINGGANEYKDYDYRPPSVSSPLDAASPLMGRFPQNITNTQDADEFYDTDTARRALTTPTVTQFKANDSTNMFATCLNLTEQALWENWKDHFFYVVSESHQNTLTPGPPDPILNNRCNLGGVTDCVTINGNEVAAIVFYADSATATQSRDSTPVDADQKRLLSNYLETVTVTQSNAHFYPVDIGPGYTGDDRQYLPYSDSDDLAYCITVNLFSNSYMAGAC